MGERTNFCESERNRKIITMQLFQNNLSRNTDVNSKYHCSRQSTITQHAYFKFINFLM
jgi:hypothetical protein